MLAFSHELFIVIPLTLPRRLATIPLASEPESPGGPGRGALAQKE